jgi:uncharacterized protein (TIGR00369 family)
MSAHLGSVPQETFEFTKKIPFSEHLGIKVDGLEKGVARLSMQIKPEFMTSWGTAHGGSILSLLDITLSMTARTLYDPPRSIMTIDLSTQFISTATGLLRAEGRVMRAGKSTIFCEGEARDDKGELVAKAIGTFRPIDPKR